MSDGSESPNSSTSFHDSPLDFSMKSAPPKKRMRYLASQLHSAAALAAVAKAASSVGNVQRNGLKESICQAESVKADTTGSPLPAGAGAIPHSANVQAAAVAAAAAVNRIDSALLLQNLVASNQAAAAGNLLNPVNQAVNVGNVDLTTLLSQIGLPLQLKKEAVQVAPAQIQAQTRQPSVPASPGDTDDSSEFEKFAEQYREALQKAGDGKKPVRPFKAYPKEQLSNSYQQHSAVKASLNCAISPATMVSGGTDLSSNIRELVLKHMGNQLASPAANPMNADNAHDDLTKRALEQYQKWREERYSKGRKIKGLTFSFTTPSPGTKRSINESGASSSSNGSTISRPESTGNEVSSVQSPSSMQSSCSALSNSPVSETMRIDAPTTTLSDKTLKSKSNIKNPYPTGDDKDRQYWERRRKNNEAAKRSRDTRRRKEDEIALRCAFLEQENLKLKLELSSLKQETYRLKCLLYNS